MFLCKILTKDTAWLVLFKWNDNYKFSSYGVLACEKKLVLWLLWSELEKNKFDIEFQLQAKTG